MGIKFHCPNGHKLNVKAFLAEKTGICPKCGERFKIPTRSGGQVVSKGRKRSKVETPGERGQGTGVQGTGVQGTGVQGTGVQGTGAGETPIALDVQDVTRARTSEAPANPDLFGTDPDLVWYVRPASGGQFGPASGDIMRQWIDEGRIAADSMVWQNGWETWQKADELFPEVSSGTPPNSRQEDQAIAVSPAIDVADKPRIRRKRNSMMTLSVILIGVVVVLAAILVTVIILMR